MLNTYAKLKGLMREQGLTYSDLAKTIGISHTSFVSEINQKTEFSVSEARAIKDALHLSVDQYVEIFFAIKVAYEETFHGRN